MYLVFDKNITAEGQVKLLITNMLTVSRFGKRLVELEGCFLSGFVDKLERHAMVKNTNGSSSIVIVCEHASSDIPASFNSLGVSKEVRKSHAAWDPGALAVSIRLSEQLDAALIAGAVSRLVYDCNRPPDAPDAMPSKSEIFDIPGNAHLSQSERDSRVKTF